MVIIIWKYDNGKYLFMAPIIDNQGNVYFGCQNNFQSEEIEPEFICLNPQGELKWKLQNQIEYPTASIDKNGNIYLAYIVPQTENSGVLCLDYSGNIKWTYNGGMPLTAFLCDKEDNIYYGGFHAVVKLNSNGALQNLIPLSDEYGYACPAIGFNRIFFSTVSPNKIFYAAE